MLPESLFANLIWTALHTEHRRFAVSNGLACRYPAAVAPFAAISEPSLSALEDLATLLAPQDSVWLFHSSLPPHPALKVIGTLPCLRMTYPGELSIPPRTNHAVLPLSIDDSADMVALTSVAFPGFFRSRTSEMGTYFGIRDSSGRLVSMCGERICVPGYNEASGLCTHPDLRGRGYGEALLWEVVRHQRATGIASFCHVATSNTAALALYRRMGFLSVCEVPLICMARA